MVADPLFADLAGGDLHPRSQGGRYVPASAFAMTMFEMLSVSCAAFV